METKIASVQTEKGLSVIQFISSNIDTFEYVSLGKAASEKMIELMELEEGASVNDIMVINHSDNYVFMMDGDIIEGAKQNRIINTSILLAPKKKTKVHVSCVEQGRWKNVSDTFMPSDYVASASMRQMKNEDVFFSLKKQNNAYADQNKVWNRVAESSAEFDVSSETGSLSDIVKENEEKFKIFSDNFKLDDKVNGLALFYENKFVSLDLFNGSKVYREYFPKILKGAAIQFSHNKKKLDDVNEGEIKYRLLETLDKIEVIDKSKYEGVGVGIEERFQEEKLNGFQLMFENNLIHLTAMTRN